MLSSALSTLGWLRGGGGIFPDCTEEGDDEEEKVGRKTSSASFFPSPSLLKFAMEAKYANAIVERAFNNLGSSQKEKENFALFTSALPKLPSSSRASS